jgi:alpha-tubulin suppressor-like RCC1 family protein
MPPPNVDLGGMVAEALAMGAGVVCAHAPNENPRCWGNNNHGQLGHEQNYNTLGDLANSMPPPITDVAGPVGSMSGGYDHTCAVMPGGQVRCWGGSLSGALGVDYNNNDRGDDPGEMPPPILNAVPGPVTQLVSGYYFNVALRQDGTVYCWGRSFEGACATGSNTAVQLWVDGIAQVEFW